MRSLVVVALAASAEACSTAAPVTSSHEAPAAACDVADAVLAGPSPFETALARYVTEGATPAVRAALASACGESRPADGPDETLEGEAAACTVLAVLFLSGEAGARDPREASLLFERASLRHAHNAHFDLGGCHDHAATAASGITWGSSMCCSALRGCPRGCEARCHDARAAVQARVVAPLERACRAGRGAACHVLARVVALGSVIEGVGQIVEGADTGRASELEERACALGVGPSCVSGDDETKLARACALDAPAGCLELGKLRHARGDLARAELDWQRACRLGARSVCRELADLYARGEIVRADAAKAAEYAALAR